MHDPASPSVISSEDEVRKISAVVLDYMSLIKPEITFLVTISAFAGYLMASTESFDPFLVVALLGGVVLSSSGGAALNHYVERDFDKQMKRTGNRPLPAGRITPFAALVFGGLLSVAGVAILLVFTNLLTAFLAGLTIVLYVLLYTPMKRRTKYNTLIGTIPGALPALGGWTAATGGLGLGGWVIFSILLIWQLPHFFALAWMYRKDYDRAGFQMLPVVEPDGQSTANQVLLASAVLLVLCLLPSFFGLAGTIYMAGSIGVSAWLLWESIRFYKSRSNLAARRVLKASVFHIPVIVMLLIVDRII